MKKRIVMVAGFMMMMVTVMNAQHHRADGHRKAGDRVEYLKKELSLTDDQTAKMKTINDQYAPKFKALRSDSTQAKASKIESMKKLNDEKTQAMKGILSETQFTKYTTMQTKRIGRARSWMDADRMKKDLALNDDQYAKVKSSNKKFGDQFKALRKDSTQSQEVRKTELKKIGEARKAELKTILTDEQYAKWDAMKGKHGDHHRKGSHSMKH